MRALALSQLGQRVRGYRRRERVEAIERALRAELPGLREGELRRATAVLAYLHSVLAYTTLREENGLSGEEIGDSIGWAIRTLVEDLRKQDQNTRRFKNAGSGPARLLFVHMPAALEEFFEEFGVPVGRPGEIPHDVEPPDFDAMPAALERNGVRVIAGG